MIRAPLTAAACVAALIALAACGGGGGSTPVTSTDQPTQDELDAAERERLERERQAREEQERLEREREEREAREQAEREEAARREREEQERLERERREREARERAEREAAERAAALLPFPLPTGGMQNTGINQPYTRLDQLPLADERGAINIHYGHFNDGAGRETVAAYLAEAWAGVAGRFTTAPTVRVIGPSTAREREIVADAVDAINLSLPADLRMQIAPPDPQRSLRHAVGSNGRFYGTYDRPAITVEFLDCADYVKCGRAGATTWASDGYGPPFLERGGYVQFSRGTFSYRDDWQARVLMAHELLHVVSVDGHVSDRFDSIMRASGHHNSATALLMSPLDREAINVLYRRLQPGDDPTSFGPWSSTSLHLVVSRFRSIEGRAFCSH